MLEMQMPPGYAIFLQARGDVHPISVNFLALHYHIAKVDADTKFHSAGCRDVGIFFLQRGLDLDRAFDRVHRARKFGEHTVTSRIYESAVVPLDQRVDYLPMG
jgi:hypothetical protein